MSPEAREAVDCNLCGSARRRPFARRQGFDVVACAECGLVYVSPRLAPQALVAHYNGDESSRVQYYLEAEPADRRSFAAMLAALEGLRPGRGRLLDVGPNVGTALALARERGWESAGVEINAAAARHCREVRGLDVRTGTLDERRFPAQSFAAVLMADVIEHLPDPRGTLGQVRELLQPGGVVAISTPDVSSWAGRALQLKPVEHLYYFSPSTLRAMLERAGLELLELRPYDRHKNLTAMTHSTTCGSLFRRLAPLFRLSQRLLGDVVVRLPLRENLLALARRPALPA